MSSPNYFCTWHLMYWYPKNRGEAGLQSRDVLCDTLLFGEGGIAVTAYPQVRDKLYFLLDDGWDVRSSRGGTLPESQWFRPYVGSCQLCEEKFPGYGKSHQERLKTLADKVKAQGWRGLGLWISPTVSYAADVEGRGDSFADFWRRRMEWSKAAGVAYWKVDWGDFDVSDKHRDLLSELKREIYPELIMEHAVMRDPWNRKGMESRFYIAAHRNRLAYSDVLRTYDVTFALSIPTTLSRVAELLTHPPQMREDYLGLINAEDEVYLCAALGLCFGVMRFDIGDFPVNSGPNWAFGGKGNFPATRPARKQLDEVSRAVRWQSDFAPAFSAAVGETRISAENAEDSWHFTPDETWAKPLCGNSASSQCAPLSVARSCSLPRTDAKGEKPYLVACRNPNGALSIAALGRVTPERGYFTPRRDVYWGIGENTGYIGVFGAYNSLALEFSDDLSGKKVYAKDLLENDFRDITEQVRITENTIVLDGGLLEKIGTRCNSAGDFSEPALVMRFGEEGDFVPHTSPKARPKAPKGNFINLSMLALMARGKSLVLRVKKYLQPS